MDADALLRQGSRVNACSNRAVALPGLGQYSDGVLAGIGCGADAIAALRAAGAPG